MVDVRTYKITSCPSLNLFVFLRQVNNIFKRERKKGELNFIMATILCILTQLESTGQNVTVRPATMPQVVQFPTLQQTVPVQVPLTTANGQTVYHTVHFPLQALAATSLAPNISQVQMIPQVC